MKKEILYLTEYLAKSDNEQEKAFYQLLVQTLTSLELYTPTKFTQAQIRALMSRQGLDVPATFEESVKALDSTLDAALPKALQEAKKSLFMTLLTPISLKRKDF